MACCTCFDGKSLRRQMTGKFTITFGIFLLLLVLICIIIVTVTNDKIKSDSENALYSQVETHTNRILEGSSKLLEESLKTTLEGVVRIYSKVMEDTFRTGYSMGHTPSYFDYNSSYLAPPLTQDSRQTMPVSFSDSAYYVPNSIPSDIPGFSPGVQDLRDQSVHQDPFFRTLYSEYVDFVALYNGFDTEGFFRIYPGSTVDTTRTYDPRSRGWYLNSKAADSYIITSPYLDFFGRGWMVTITTPVDDYTTSQFVGVSGGDMLISTLNENIQKIKFLDSGKVTLFERSGTVVADKEWDLDINDPTPLQYSNLRKPPVSPELWTWISSVQNGQTLTSTFTIGEADWLITTSGQSDAFDKYILTVFVLKSEITAPMRQIIDEMNRLNVAIPLGLLVGSILLGLLTILLVFLISKKISKPFDDSRKNIAKLQKNFGKDDLTEGLTQIDHGVGREQYEFTEAISRVIQATKDTREVETVHNQLYESNQYIVPYGSGQDAHVYYEASAPSLEDIMPPGSVLKMKEELGLNMERVDI